MGNLERISFIDQRIKERGGVSTREVAERFEVSERQVRRDLAYLRDRLDAPLVWDAGARRYTYERSWNGLAFADEKALLFSVFADAAARSFALVPLAEPGPLERLREFVSPALRPLAGAIRYELPGFEPPDSERLSLVLLAMREGRALDGAYRDLEGHATERTIAPMRIVNYAGTWYCAAFDLGKRALRIFRISRFKRLSLSAERPVELPAAAEVDAFLDASYGMFKGSADKRAVMRFRGRAREIAGAEHWHPEECAREGADEAGPYFELELPVSQWDEVLGRLLRFGPEGEAVAPLEFRERWLSAIDAMTELARRVRKVPHCGTTT